MKKIILAISFIVVAWIGWQLVSDEKQPESDLVISESKDLVATRAEVLVNPQSSNKEISVKQATLVEPGFLVLREVINGKAAQIVEISPYLEVGTYTDIVISVGDFYKGDADLMVVVYADEKNDRTLNDLDQPYLDSNGMAVATYVTTGLSVEEQVFKADQATLPVSISMGGMSMPTITYTNDGFEPAILEVNRGAMVHFVNESDTQMWVASDSHPAHDVLPTFDQFKPNDMYMYIFEEAGEWDFHDHLNAALTGTIIVKN